jgi:hypothetical protein
MVRRTHKSLIVSPDATLFWTSSRIGVFQQPRLFLPTENPHIRIGDYTDKWNPRW